MFSHHNDSGRPCLGCDRSAVLYPTPSQTCAPRNRTARQRNSRGNAIIEFSLLLPILLMLSVGMIAVGFALWDQILLVNAVNLSAQTIAFSRGLTTDPCATGYSTITNAAPALNSGLSVTFTINGTAYAATTCTAGAANMIQGAAVTVAATYPVTLSFWMFAPGKIGTKTTEVIQ